MLLLHIHEILEVKELLVPVNEDKHLDCAAHRTEGSRKVPLRDLMVSDNRGGLTGRKWDWKWDRK